MSLLGIQRQRKKECSFQSKKQFATFLKDNGITPFMKEMNIIQEKEGIHSNLNLSSPSRQPFLLKYHEESNGSYAAPPSLGDE